MEKKAILEEEKKLKALIKLEKTNSVKKRDTIVKKDIIIKEAKLAEKHRQEDKIKSKREQILQDAKSKKELRRELLKAKLEVPPPPIFDLRVGKGVTGPLGGPCG